MLKCLAHELSCNVAGVTLNDDDMQSKREPGCSLRLASSSTQLEQKMFASEVQSKYARWPHLETLRAAAMYKCSDLTTRLAALDRIEKDPLRIKFSAQS